MADTDPSRLGLVNATGSADNALFLKKFSGEVLRAYKKAIMILPKVRQRRIMDGKSAQFPAIGRAAASYHQAGTNILDTGGGILTEVKHGEQEIFVDDLLVSGAMIDRLDELKNHYDARAPYAEEFAQALADKTDQQLLQVIGLGAAAAVSGTGITVDYLGGFEDVDAGYANDADTILAGLQAVSEQFDANHVPTMNRFAAMDSVHYNLLVDNKELIDRDFGGERNGVFADGTVFKAWGFTLIKTQNMPTGVVGAETGVRNTYDGDFSNTEVLCWHRDSIGSVALMDVQTEMGYFMEFQGHLLLAKKAVGHGPLKEGGMAALKSA